MIAAVTAIAATGCGISPTPSVPTADAPAGYAATPEDGGELTRTVVLDWTGGSSDVVSSRLSAVDFAEMYLASGDSLEHYEESFQEAVRLRVEEILSALEPARFDVVTGESGNYPDDTVVYFTSDAVADDGLQVGQTRLDRCDLRREASVVVWGGTLLSLGNDFAYQEWVNVFANIAAHEVGHTVGFYHPDAVLTDLTDYEKDNEIMLAVHTLSALLGPQEFMIPQETCPESIEQEYGGVAYEISDASTAKRPTVSYRGTGPTEEVIYCNCQ